MTEEQYKKADILLPKIKRIKRCVEYFSGGEIDSVDIRIRIKDSGFDLKSKYFDEMLCEELMIDVEILKENYTQNISSIFERQLELLRKEFEKI